MAISDEDLDKTAVAASVAEAGDDVVAPRLQIDEQLARQHARTVTLLSEMAAARVQARRSARRRS